MSHAVAAKLSTWITVICRLDWAWGLCLRACPFTYCRLEVSVPQRILTGDLNPLPSGPLHRVVPMSSREQSEREQGGKCNAFNDLASEVTHHHLCYILLATQTNPDTICQSITCYHSILHIVSRMIFTQLKLLNSFLFSSG